jgi:CHAT domain-containing protein/Tfp pilus assembly protein PilF
MPSPFITKSVPPLDLAVLIDELLGVKTTSGIQELIEERPGLRERETIFALADAVNRIAREDLLRAERVADAVHNLAELSGDKLCRARTSRAVGNMRVLRGEYTTALEIFQESMDLFRELGEEIEEAATLSSSLQALIYLGRYTEALAGAEKARQIAKRHHDEVMLARVEVNFGNIVHRQDRFGEAVSHYKRALETLEKLGEYRDCAIAWMNLAVCYISMSDTHKAENAYQHARSISERENMRTIVAQSDYNIAYLHYKRGEYTRAIQLYQQTRAYCERVSDRYHSALCDLDQAEMYLELHLNVEGIQLGQRARTSFEQMNMGYEAAKATAWLGIGAYQEKKAFQALELFAQAQDLMSREQNTVWIATLDFYKAVVLQQEGRLHEALRACRIAQGVFSAFPSSYKMVYADLLRASIEVRLGEFVQATKWSTAAVEAAERSQSPFLLSQSLCIQGQIREAENSIPAARRSYRSALQSLEEAPTGANAQGLKLTLSRNPFELYEALVALSLFASTDPGDFEPVFEIAEKAKSRELAELLSFRANTLPTPSRNRSRLVEQVKELREGLNWNYRQVNQTEFRNAQDSAQDSQTLQTVIRDQEAVLMKAMGELRATEGEFHALQSASIIPIDKIRGILRKDELILEFYQARGILYVFLLGRDHLHALPIAQVGAVRDLMRSLKGQFSKFDMGKDYALNFAQSLHDGVRGNLTALYRELIEPIREHLWDYRLIIVPDGPLHYLPFHALFDGSRYLGEDHVISYAGSSSLYYLSSCRQIDLPDHNLVLAPEHRENDGMASQLEKLLPNVRTFWGAEADVAMLEKHGPGSGTIHFDAHLKVRLDNPLFSTFALGDKEISILDTYHLRLPCSLIGLAGTGPGLRPSGNGEEIHVLARGLEYAGAQTLLMPLWNVSGNPIECFLREFYTRSEFEADKPLVFQESVGRVREQFPNPYHWSSYILRGKSGRSSNS